MALAYPHRWASAFPTPKARQLGKRVWALKLRGLSADEIEAGCDRWSGDWPPSAPEFRRACRPPREPYQRLEFQGEALPLWPADKSLAQSYIDQIRHNTQQTGERNDRAEESATHPYAWLPRGYGVSYRIYSAAVRGLQLSAALRRPEAGVPGLSGIRPVGRAAQPEPAPKPRNVRGS